MPRLVEVDTTDRADDRIVFWDNAAGIHKYKDEAGGGIDSGTAFPGTPAAGDLFFHTTYGMLFFYDGTRWLTTTLYTDALPVGESTFAATAVTNGIATPLGGSMAMWLETADLSFIITPGTALSASHKWVCVLQDVPTGATHATFTIDSGALGTWRRMSTVTVGAALATTETALVVVSTKTGTPGTLRPMPRISYRLIGT